MKYRVWHKEFKKFLPKEEWYLNMDGKLVFYGITDNQLNFADDSLYIVQRCLEFKNVLVYEGDVVSIDDKYEEGRKHIGIVEYRDGGFYVDTDDGLYTFTLDSDEGVEVIGNMFENK